MRLFMVAWPAQSVEYGILDLGVVSWSPMLSVEIKNKIIKSKKNMYAVPEALSGEFSQLFPDTVPHGPFTQWEPSPGGWVWAPHTRQTLECPS